MALRKKDFVTYGPKGSVLALDCKICGTRIASTYLRPGPFPASVPIPKFSRNNLYAEIKFEFDDGSYHVTNGCKNCLGKDMSPELLQELFNADMEDALVHAKAGAKPTKVVVLDTTAGGII